MATRIGQGALVLSSVAVAALMAAGCGSRSELSQATSSGAAAPPPAGCSQHTMASDCTQDAACRWLVQGCEYPSPQLALGCFPAADCASNADCGGGTICTMVSYDPCWEKKCDACSALADVCVPPGG